MQSPVQHVHVTTNALAAACSPHQGIQLFAWITLPMSCCCCRHKCLPLVCSKFKALPIRCSFTALMASKSMRAAVIYEAGGPEALKLETRPIPIPKPGWILINVKAFGLNRSELFTRQGHSPGA